ncbi:MAG: hypothetical protein LC104_16800 [Bacteroidales bacterium]|nr:hypothetical protein [Bacteroidales bacterium]
MPDTSPNRRAFLALAAGLVAGCGRESPSTHAVPAVTDAEQAAWLARQRSLAQRFGVAADAARTTPEPPFPVTQPFPELKPLMKLTVRLHPRLPRPDDHRFDQERTASKIGGIFAVPKSPLRGRNGCIPILQLRVEDAPPHLRFDPNTSLMQVYWQVPTHPGEPPIVRTVFIEPDHEKGGTPPLPEGIPLAWVPFPCRVFPERVAEYPSPYLMPKMMRERIAAWKPPDAERSGTDFFLNQLGPAPGTKVGGWPRILGEPNTPTCEQCHRLMDFLMTVATREWDAPTVARWQPQEERGSLDPSGYQSALGLDLGDRHHGIHIYLCNTCPDHPSLAQFT